MKSGIVECHGQVATFSKLTMSAMPEVCEMLEMKNQLCYLAQALKTL